MPSPIESPETVDPAEMTKVQKLAVLLIILGPESAARLMKQLDESELEVVTAEMTRISVVTQEMRAEVLREFTDIAVQAGSCTLGGRDFARSTLEKSIGPDRARDLLDRVAPAPRAPLVMQEILEMEPRQIFSLLREEQPQTIALIVSYLPPEKTSRVLLLLEPALRDRVVERLATMAATPLDVVERVVELLRRRMAARSAHPLHQTGGIRTAADVLNTMDKNLSRALLISLEERNPELGAAIRDKMFTFDDLGSLQSGALQRILREIEMRDLALSLKTVGEVLRRKLLACISKRAAETVHEEMSFMGPVRLREVEAAQGRILEVVRRLEAEGEVDLGRSGNPSDELVA